MSTNPTRKPEERLPKFEVLADTISRVIDNIGKRTGQPELATGVHALDRGTNGLHRTQMTILAARPGQGKTSLACQIAYNLAKQGKRVAFVSLEMTKETILERMFCNEFEVNGFDLLIGKVTEEEYKKLSKFHLESEKLPLHIIDDYCFTENELYTLFDHMNFRPDVLILDHIQHIRSVGRNSMWETLTNYLRFLKEISMRHNIASLVLSQINRDGEEKPTLANLKGTGGIEEMADHVLLMSQKSEEEIGEHMADGVETNFTVKLAKNRFGPIGNFHLFYKSKYCKFENR